MPPKEVELPALANGDANAELTDDDEDADFTALDVRSMCLFLSLALVHKFVTNILQSLQKLTLISLL